MNKIKMSVIVPTHSRIELFKKTLESLINQTSTEFEVIITDDSSNESERSGIKQIVEEGQRKNKNISISYIFTHPNLLQAKNTNQGFKNAKGDYLRILHSDDVIAPQCIEKEIQAFEKNPDCFFLNHRAVRFTDAIEFKKRDIIFSKFNIFNCWLNNGAIFTGCVLPSCLAFRREIYQNIDGMNEEYKFLCDWDFFFKIILNEWLCGRDSAIYVSGELVAWRQHDNAITSTMPLTHFYEHEEFTEHLFDIYKKYNIVDKKTLKEFINNAIDYRYCRILDDYKNYHNFVLPNIPKKYTETFKYEKCLSKYNKLKKHIKKFFRPFIVTIEWIIEPISILFYLLSFTRTGLNYLFSKGEIK